MVHRWLIAEFKESNCTKPSCAIIAKNWHVSENVCRYPNTKDVFRRKTLTEKCEQYTPKWQYCDINRILKTDITDFKEALKYLEEFEDHSEVDSELTDSSPQKSPIRKKVVKSKPKIIDASQNLFNLPPPPAWKDNLPPPPPQKETPISRKGNPSSAASTNISSGDLTAAQNSRQSEKIVNSSPQNGENSKSRPEDNQLDVEVETNLNITFPTPPNNTNNTGLSNSDETGPWIMTKGKHCNVHQTLLFFNLPVEFIRVQFLFLSLSLFFKIFALYLLPSKRTFAYLTQCDHFLGSKNYFKLAN